MIKYRYSAFHTPSGLNITRGETPAAALRAAVRGWQLPDTSQLEVIETGPDTTYLWDLANEHVPPLAEIRSRYRTVFRGNGVAGFPPVPMQPGEGA